MDLQPIKNLIKNYGLLLITYFIFFAILGIIQGAFPSLDFDKYQQEELTALMGESPLKLIFLVLIAAPILEESMFRSIVKPAGNDLIIFFCAWVFLFATILLPEDIIWYIKYGFLLLFIVLIFIFLQNFFPKKIKENLERFLSKFYLFFWLASALIFGLVHIFNYVDTFYINLILFLLIFPRVIAGYYLGKIKIENRDIEWSYLLHAMNNATVLIFIFPSLV